jgi:hypothetical protein
MPHLHRDWAGLGCRQPERHQARRTDRRSRRVRRAGRHRRRRRGPPPRPFAMSASQPTRSGFPDGRHGARTARSRWRRPAIATGGPAGRARSSAPFAPRRPRPRRGVPTDRRRRRQRARSQACISYATEHASAAARRRALRETWRFECACARCAPGGSSARADGDADGDAEDDGFAAVGKGTHWEPVSREDRQNRGMWAEADPGFAIANTSHARPARAGCCFLSAHARARGRGTDPSRQSIGAQD